MKKKPQFLKYFDRKLGQIEQNKLNIFLYIGTMYFITQRLYVQVFQVSGISWRQGVKLRDRK